MITTRSPRERAYLVGILLPGVTPERLRDQMAELADLARTAGTEVVGTDVQRRYEVDPAHFLGMGKVASLRDMKLEGEFDVVICNEDLSPRQQRNLELEVKARVLDRTEIILEIFAQHARTHEGRLQVEAARLHHLLPRLIGAYAYDRQVGGRRGGVGARGGFGEQQIEVERRRIRKRMRDLDREIEQVRTQRHQQRTGRRRAALETAAIVGYTNAGKSTLLNVLTGADVRAEHRLFRRRAITTLSERYPGAVAISALKRTGFSELLKAIDRASRGDAVAIEILVPYGREGVLAELRKIGGVERTEYVDSGTLAWGWAPRQVAGRFQNYSANGKA